MPGPRLIEEGGQNPVALGGPGGIDVAAGSLITAVDAEAGRLLVLEHGLQRPLPLDAPHDAVEVELAEPVLDNAGPPGQVVRVAEAGTNCLAAEGIDLEHA